MGVCIDSTWTAFCDPLPDSKQRRSCLCLMLSISRFKELLGP